MYDILKNMVAGIKNANNNKSSSLFLGLPQAPTEEQKIKQNNHKIGQALQVSSAGNLPKRSNLLFIDTTSHSAEEMKDTIEEIK